MKDIRKIRRIGLISPCSGNLGNAAILTSMITNIRARIPDVEIVGITLSPEDTQRRHGIDGFCITGTSHNSYHLASPVGSMGERYNSGAPRRIKERLKRIKWLRALVVKGRTARLELAHIIRSARLVRTLDRVIITGGGALDDFWGGAWGQPWTLFKFGVLSRLSGVPFLFVSVGKCSLDQALSRRFVGWALRLAEYRSYRDQESLAEVKVKFPRLSATLSPDLAYGYSCPDLSAHRIKATSGKQLELAVSPIAFCDPRSWPVKDGPRYSRYMDQLAKFLKWALEEGYRLTFFATDSPDSETIKDLLELLSAMSVNLRDVRVLPGPPEQTTEGLLGSICNADLVVASRLHAVILAHLISLPVLAISYDKKVDVHMSEIGQTESCVNIDQFAAETLVERFDVLRDARKLESARIERAVQICRQQATAQYDLLFGVEPTNAMVNPKRETLLTQAQR